MSKFLQEILRTGPKSARGAASHFSSQAGTKQPPLVQVTLEPRDYWQSGFSGVPNMNPGSPMLRYISQADQLNHVTDGGDPWVKSIMSYGGTWWQLPAMNDINPFDYLRAVQQATPNGTPIECLQRSSHGFSLEESSQPVLEEKYRAIGKIFPGRSLPIRLFQFNNNAFQKDSTYGAIDTLRQESAGNFVISDEWSYSRFMNNETVAQGVVAGIMRNLRFAAQYPNYPLQGGIKDFSGDLAPEDAKAILMRVHVLLNQTAEELEREGKQREAELLRGAVITEHSHLTDRTRDTSQAWIETAVALERPVTVHGIHAVENATHPTLQEHILPHMKAAGIVVSKEQEALNTKMSETLATLVSISRDKTVRDYIPTIPRPATGFAGGGKPMIMQYVNNIAAFLKISPVEAEILLNVEMGHIRDKNKIPPVTPAQKAIADLALLKIQNRGSYDGMFTPEAIDVIRNLRPEQAEEKELLESGYRQHRDQVLKAKVTEGAISQETADKIRKIGMNAEKSSMDKEQTRGILEAASVDTATIEDIIEASGHATQPTKFPDQMKRAEDVVNKLEAEGQLKITDRKEATILVATLWGRDYGKTLVQHHGDPSKFPALAQKAPPPSYHVREEKLGHVADAVAWQPIRLLSDEALVKIVGEETMARLLLLRRSAIQLEGRLSDSTRLFGDMKERYLEALEQNREQAAIPMGKARETFQRMIEEDVKAGHIDAGDAAETLTSSMHQLDGFIARKVHDAIKAQGSQRAA